MAAPSRLFTLRSTLFTTKYFCSKLHAPRSRILKLTNKQTTSKFIHQSTRKHGTTRRLNLSRVGFVTASVVGVTAGAKIVTDILPVEAGAPKGPLQITPSKSIHVDTDSSGLKLTLFQYQTCPFCCKVRALLDYYGFSYDVVEVNSVWRTETKWSIYKKVPILVVYGSGKDDYLQLNDSSVIMSILESHLVDRSQSVEKLLSFYPSIESKNDRGKIVFEFPNKYFIMYQDQKAHRSAEQMKEERKWRSWVDDVLVHTLSPNVYRTPTEAVQAFKYFSDVGGWENTFSTLERTVVIYVGAVAMYIVGKLLKKKYNLKEDVRQSLYDDCKMWTKAVGPDRQYMGGDQPNLADLSVYGVLHSIEGCDAFQDVLKNTRIHPWYNRMKNVTSSHAGANPLNKQ